MQKTGAFETNVVGMWPGVGIESDKNAQTLEPPLQHKKRIEGPPTSLSREYFSKPSDAPEYTLLGQQNKFAHNVKYQAKQAVEGGIYKNKENFDNAPPPSKQLKMQKRIKPLIKERHPTVGRSPQHLSDTQTPLSPPPAPRRHKDNIELKEAMKDKDLRDVLGDKTTVSKPEPTHNWQRKEVSQSKEFVQTDKKKDVDVSAPAFQNGKKDKDLRDAVRDTQATDKSEKQAPQATQIEQKKEVPRMNEFVQTNLRKGVAVSAPEAPADYALRYKAQLAPPRQLRKVSEYQKQFQWKNNIKASPLLNAEEIVFKSSTNLGPYKHDGVPRVSEYRRQFHPWKPEAYSSDMNLNMNNNNNNNTSYMKAERKKKPLVKRSKSTGAVCQQDVSVNDENDENVAESDSGELKSKLKKSHGKMRLVTTEYRANFRSPTSYKYDHGVWKGAYPPQLIPQIASDDALNVNTNSNNNSNNKKAQNSSLPNWFAEVIELRRRADEYRRRARGTHFSREHLVQLLAKQNQCWDIDAETSPTIDALYLESPAGIARASKKLRAAHSVPKRHSAVVSDGDDTEQEQETSEKGERIQERKEGANSPLRKSRKMAWLEEQKEKIAQQRRRLEEERARVECEDSDDADEKMEGRLPTPVLKQNASPIRRHHLDLTTPSVGGAILTCPPSKDNKMIVTSRTGSSYVTASDDYPVKSLPKTYKVDNLRTTPIYGKPSEDTHHLRNDSVDSDRPLRTQYVPPPPISESDEDKENQSDHRQSKRNNQKIRSSDLTAVPEGYGRTYNLSKPFLNLADLDSKDDDDVMSVSLMSVASSSSLASEVLERTKKRQKFWNKNGTH